VTRTLQGILTTLFALARVYFMRGSAKESQFFLEQARTLADSVRAKGLLCRALLRLAELKIYSGCLEDADQLLSGAAPMLLQVGSVIQYLACTAC
jgi:separase